MVGPRVCLKGFLDDTIHSVYYYSRHIVEYIAQWRKLIWPPLMAIILQPRFKRCAWGSALILELRRQPLRLLIPFALFYRLIVSNGRRRCVQESDYTGLTPKPAWLQCDRFYLLEIPRGGKSHRRED
jgi:hypothetical protein